MAETKEGIALTNITVKKVTELLELESLTEAAKRKIKNFYDFTCFTMVMGSNE